VPKRHEGGQETHVHLFANAPQRFGRGEERCLCSVRTAPSGLTAYCHALDVRPAKRRAFTIGKGQRCEVDHFCPVGIGCSNDQENLWIQRADTTYNGQPMGFHQKDDLEAWGIAQVKAGTLTPEEFDRRIWGDWVSYYLEVRPQHSNVSN
jgi:hypothetical protein